MIAYNHQTFLPSPVIAEFGDDVFHQEPVLLVLRDVGRVGAPLRGGAGVGRGPPFVDGDEVGDEADVPERIKLKFSVKVSVLSVKLFISQCTYFADSTLNI